MSSSALYCPSCGQPPVVIGSRELKLREPGAHWARAFCRFCWGPKRSDPKAEHEPVGAGHDRESAVSDWNAQVVAKLQALGPLFARSA